MSRWCWSFLLSTLTVQFCLGQNFSCTQNGPVVHWRIDRPNVKSAITEYNSILFHAGDHVSFTAGGCVQTGGSGKTWKRYKDPVPNSKYYGTVSIPKVLPLQPLRDVNSSITIPAEVSETHLVLGYVDDDYSDNGYWNPDPGNPKQCGIPDDAFIEITIQQSVTSDACPKSLPKPFNLVPINGTDPNGFPLNPVWGSQLSVTSNQPPDPDACHYRGTNSFDPKCTDVATEINAPVLLHKTVCSLSSSPAHGKPRAHFNWSPAAFIAPVYWGSHQDPTVEDDDVDLWITPPHAAGVTADNVTKINEEAAIEVEFRMKETFRRFIRGAIPKWDEIVDAIDQEDNSQGGDPNGPPSKFNNRCAVVVGLFGLDCDHGCKSELHPAYGFALHVKDDPSDDTWLIFARNIGNEGYCSSKFEHLSLADNRLTVMIPRPGAQFLQLLSTSQFFSTLEDSAVQIEISPTNANSPAAVTFAFPTDVPATPDQAEMIFGELHLQWNNASMIKVGDRACGTPSSPLTIIKAAESEETDGLRKLGIISKEKDRERQLLRERDLRMDNFPVPPAPSPTATPIVGHTKKPLPIKIGNQPLVARHGATLVAVDDPNQAAQQAKEREALCAGISPKSMPTICKSDTVPALAKKPNRK